MGKKGNQVNKPKNETARPDAAQSKRAAPDWSLLILAGIGLVVTGLLLWSTLTATTLPYCKEGSGCDVVQNSRWSQFLGVPLVIWGIATYVAIGLSAVIPASPTARRRWSSLIVSAGFGISVYLTVISVTVIEATCIYCLVSLVVMAGGFGLSFLPPEAPAPTRRAAGLGLAAAIAVVMHIDAGGAFDETGGVADPYLKGLAVHLEQRGVKFYGASWCPHCQQQKELFGGAARFLPYVECSPHGRKAPRATACEMEAIRNYPTWVIDERRVERVLATDTLAKLSGFSARADLARAGGDAR